MFINKQQFPFVAYLESQWEVIRDEFLALSNESFDPWVQQSMHGEGWSVYGLVAGGHHLPGCQHCPRTTEIISHIGGVGLAGFSRMAPRTHIVPHRGWATNEYRLHLGLVVPDGCRLRVEEETRAWQEGACLIFDDTTLHEAWNDSDAVRGNLMLDFLRPGKTRFSSNIPQGVKEYAMSLLNEDDGDL